MIALSFFIGLMVGGTVGVVTMCCFQVGKESDKHIEGKQRDENKAE